MTEHDLSAVGRRLEEAVEHLAVVRPNEDRRQLYEEVSIAILDSGHNIYPEGELSADALGIVACLTAYSHLSFGKNEAFAPVCAE